MTNRAIRFPAVAALALAFLALPLAAQQGRNAARYNLGDGKLALGGYDPVAYIDAIPADRVCQYHLAGHTNKGTHIIDTHNDHVLDPVWELFGHTIRTVGLRATLLEWDADIPPFEVVHQEVLKADDWRRQEVADVA